jgi:hypothetical protein
MTDVPSVPPTPENINSYIEEKERRRKLFESDRGRSRLQRTIDGEFGPPMTGVLHYPFSQAQRLYLEDFRSVVAGTITHPFVTTTRPGAGSLPHNILSGSNYDDDKVNKNANWVSEQQREYVSKDLTAAAKINAVGVRAECIQFLG